uniref:Cyclin C-terminal domain-containing protein n=1 Tax=Zea mays TaxID=4577 RepID=A0A804NXJ9_MAIZE
MVPGYDCAASVLLCAEDNAAILGLDDDGEESSWAAAATPPRDTVAAAAAAATGVAVDGILTEFPLLSDDCVATLVEKEVEHMPAEGYLQKLQRRHGDLDLAAVRKDAIDWIWKEGRAWMTQLLAVACLSLASKIEETFVPLPLDLQVAEAKFVFEGRTIKRMELLVLSTLKWRMHAVTACSFVEYFLHKLSDHGAPSLLARSRSSDLVLSTAKGAEFVVFRPSEIAASVALAAIGECRSSVIERAASSCKYLDKERVLRCHEMIQEKITAGSIVLKSAGSSISSVPQSPIGVLDAAACLSQQSDDATVGSPAVCYHSSSTSKRRRITRRLL